MRVKHAEIVKNKPRDIIVSGLFGGGNNENGYNNFCACIHYDYGVTCVCIYVFVCVCVYACVFTVYLCLNDGERVVYVRVCVHGRQQSKVVPCTSHARAR